MSAPLIGNDQLMTTSNLHTGIQNQTLQYDTILAACKMPAVVKLTKKESLKWVKVVAMARKNLIFIKVN